MPVGELTDENLAFVAYLDVDVATGGPASPTDAVGQSEAMLRQI